MAVQLVMDTPGYNGGASAIETLGMKLGHAYKLARMLKSEVGLP